MLNNIILQIDSLLKSAKFETFYFERSTKRNKFCFDLLVKKNEIIFLVKVFPNIDNLNESIIENIKALSLILHSKPLLIGMKNRYQHLEDNTIYIREELPFITLKTLENILLNQQYPHVLAKRGGGVIFLDGELMKSIREKKNISRKEISDQLGVTKRTICSYENENMRPSQDIAEKISVILKDKSIYRKINLFEWQIKIHFNEQKFSQEREFTEFESNLQEIFKDLGVSTIWYKKGQVPFELTISSKDYCLNEDNEFYPLFSGVSQESKISNLNLSHLTTFAKIFQKNALFIVNNDFKLPEILKNINIPIIKLNELEKMSNEEEFIEFFHEN
jgi:putative transcriptional regulator